MEQKRISPPRFGGVGSWLLRRSSLIAYLVVVLAVLGGINILASRHDRSWDLTKNQDNSLTSESVSILRNLNQPLQFIYFDRSSNFATAREFFARYQRESNQVQVDYVDPDRHPDQARLYKIQTYGTTVVKNGSHQELVTNLAEQDLTNAMVRVLKGARKVVYFAEGEGEHDPDDTGHGGYSDVKNDLQAENFTVQKLVLSQTPKVPEDCAVLVIAGPTHPFVEPEVQAIADYVNRGGRALFLIDVDSQGPLVNYLQSTLNVKLSPDIVVDTSGIGRLFGASELMPIVATYDSHPITAKMNQTATLFPYARTVEPGSVATSKAQVSPLVETTPQSLATTQFTNGEVRVSATDRHGPLTLGVAGTLPSSASGPAGDPIPEARFVVYGSPDFPSNAIVGFNGNQDLFMNTMDWLSDQQDFITIRPKPPTNAPVNLSLAQMRYIMYSFLVGLPLLIVFFGIWTGLQRRRL